MTAWIDRALLNFFSTSPHYTNTHSGKPGLLCVQDALHLPGPAMHYETVYYSHCILLRIQITNRENSRFLRKTLILFSRAEKPTQVANHRLADGSNPKEERLTAAVSE